MEEDINLKSYLEQKFNEADNIKRTYDRRWYENLLFTYGDQWVVWDEKENMYVAPTLPSYIRRTRVVANRIFSVVRSVVSKLAGQKFRVTVIPKKPEDKNLAEVCNKILEYVISRHRFDYEIAFDLLVFGKSFVKCVFNPEIGEIIDEGIKLGDIELHHLTPFEVFIDPLATSIYDARYCFVVKIRDIDYVREKYGLVDIEPTGTPVIPMILQRLEIYYGKKPFMPKNMVIVKEFWSKGTKDYPNGLFCILVNDKLVKVEENPYKDFSGKPYIPIAECNFFVTNNQLYSTSLVEQLIPLQREYNKLRSEIILHEELMTKPKWLIPNECNVSKNSITSEPGEKIYYDARGGVPQQIQGVPPSPEYWQHLGFIKQEFDDLAGIHDVSRGKVPSGVRSYIAIAYLQEQDTSLLAVTRENMAEMYKRLGYMILQQAKQFYIEDRILTIVRSINDYEVFKFNKASLTDLSEGNIEIVIGSSMPESMVARQQFILSLYQAGLIPNPQKVLELLGLPGIEIAEDTKLDERNANMENEIMRSGVYVEVNKADNHQIHLQVHTNFMKTTEYRMLPPEVKQLFDNHTDTHQKLVNLQMMTMQQFMERLQPQRKKRSRQR